MENRSEFSPAALLSSRRRSRRFSKQTSQAEKQALNDTDDVYRLLKYGVKAHEVSDDTNIHTKNCNFEHDHTFQKSENSVVLKSVCKTSMSRFVETNTVSQNSTQFLQNCDSTTVGGEEEEEKTLENSFISPQFGEESLEFEESIGFDSNYSIDSYNLYNNELHIEEEVFDKDSIELKVSSATNMASESGSDYEVDTDVVNSWLDEPTAVQSSKRTFSSEKTIKSARIPASSKMVGVDLTTGNFVCDSRTVQRDGNELANVHDMVVVNDFCQQYY